MRPQPERIAIFDTTLRDGEQSPGASMNLAEKLRIARVLEDMRVDVIEAGFPIASQGDFEAVSKIAHSIAEVKVAGLARATLRDISRCAEALSQARQPRIHTFIATSNLHMAKKLRLSPDQVHQQVHDSVVSARNLCDDVEWSAEDATRSDPDFLCRCVETAISAGARTINIPDTVGYTVPEEFEELIRSLRERVPNIDQAVISVHCHDDLGLAVANSLAGVAGGARQIECTINGLGERAGNAALEEVVMALRVRPDRLPYTTEVKSECITKASRLVSSSTGFAVQPNKAIVGVNAFAHEAGIHQDGVLKDKSTYEIISPETVGLKRESMLVLGKHSGRSALWAKVQEIGYSLLESELDELFRRFKEIGDRKRVVHDEDIIALLSDDGQLPAGLRLVSLEVTTNSNLVSQQAKLTLEIGGNECSACAAGSGAIDAVFNAISSLLPHKAQLLLYQVHAVTPGTDAQAQVTVRLDDNGRVVNGHGSDVDTLVASCRAYLSALGRLLPHLSERRPSQGGESLTPVGYGASAPSVQSAPTSST